MITFSKYQGTGNDFILIDNRDGQLKLTRAQIANLCHRKFGIGADGLILLNSHPDLDFEMMNYNSDGGECTMCGNGGRTLVQFAHDLGIKKVHYRFLAVDGVHEAYLKDKLIELKMQDVNKVDDTPVGFVLDTGSPHLVIEANSLLSLDVTSEGRKYRTSSLFMPAGINVNFIETKEDQLFIRTYERGVEDETLSCGTGAIAAAIVSKLLTAKIGATEKVELQCPGGKLRVRYKRAAARVFEDIWLIGQAKFVYSGQVESRSP